LTYKVLLNMTPEQLQHFKQRLLEDKARLEQELEDFGSKDPARPGRYLADYPESGSSSDDDNAMEIAEYSDEISIEARLDAELRDVKKALATIEKGGYGLCKYCQKEIQVERLEARPASSSCIKCKKVLTQEM
jgi:RNA polymerase-binding protein DksA